jgi:hypothetical protein
VDPGSNVMVMYLLASLWSDSCFMDSDLPEKSLAQKLKSFSYQILLDIALRYLK